MNPSALEISRSISVFRAVLVYACCKIKVYATTPKSPLPEGIPTVPQKFSNDLPDFDLFFFVLYSYFSSSYFTCLLSNFNLIQKRLNSSRILQTWVTFPDSSRFFTVKSILCQLPSHIRYSVEMHSSAFNLLKV